MAQKEHENYTVVLTRLTEGDRPAIDEVWYHNARETRSNPHRTNGPAVILRDESTGIVLREEWCKNAEWHRLNGPAITERSAETGDVTLREWYRNGKKVTARRSAMAPHVS